MATIDTYNEINYSGHLWRLSPVTDTQPIGQSFSVASGPNYTLTDASFYIKRTGSLTGNIVAKIFAHSGTYGTSSVPTGSALATSDNIDVSTIGTSYALVNFTFSGANQITLNASTNYVLVIEYPGSDATNYISVGVDATSPSHGGNDCTFTSSTWIPNVNDLIFYVNGTAISSVSSSGFFGLF